MPGLIEELRREHGMILETLNELKTVGISSQRGREKMLAVRNLLLSHINKEDERYYPLLKRAAQNNKNLQILLNYFVKDMENVSVKAAEFFNKYAAGGNEEEFARDFKFFHLTLIDRIHTEEATLFEKFNDLST